MIEQAQFERTGGAVDCRPPTRLTLPGSREMVLAALVCFGVSCVGAYVVMETNWHLVAKLYVGINGAFFALVGLILLARASREATSRFMAKSRSRL